MPRISRRALLVAGGTTILTGASGCLGRAPDAGNGEDPADGDGGDSDAAPGDAVLQPSLEPAFEYVFPSGDGDMAVRIRKPTADGPSFSGHLEHYLTNDASLEWIVQPRAGPSGRQGGGLVLAGSISVDTGKDAVSPTGSTGGLDTYELDSEQFGEDGPGLLATDGDVGLVGPADWVEKTVSSHAAGETTYLEAVPAARTVLSAVGFERRILVIDGEEAIGSAFEDTAVASAGLPSLVGFSAKQTDEHRTFHMALQYRSVPDEADSEAVASFASETFGIDGPDVQRRPSDKLLVFSATQSYTPPEERPDRAMHPRFHEYDEESGAVLFRFGSGEQLPVERFGIEIEGESYEGDWARGQETIGEGHVIAIDAAAIEPGDQLSVTYEAPDGGYSGSSGTTVLRRLPFLADFDPDARSATVTYLEGPPLPADRLGVVIEARDEGGTEAGRGAGSERRPWSGTLTEGDTIELSDLPLEGHGEVTYERSDGETVRIGQLRFRPPGEFEFEYDGTRKRLTVTYPEPPKEDGMQERPAWAAAHRRDPEPLDPEPYEIRIDGTRAETQWDAVGDRIEPGESVTLGNVPVGAEVGVVWQGADGTAVTVGETVTLPTIEFAFDHDVGSETVTVRHAGGQAVDAGKLTLRLLPGERTVEWTGTETVEPGDELTIEDLDRVDIVVVEFAGDHVSHHRIEDSGKDS